MNVFTCAFSWTKHSWRDPHPHPQPPTHVHGFSYRTGSLLSHSTHPHAKWASVCWFLLYLWKWLASIESTHTHTHMHTKNRQMLPCLFMSFLGISLQANTWIWGVCVFCFVTADFWSSFRAFIWFHVKSEGIWQLSCLFLLSCSQWLWLTSSQCFLPVAMLLCMFVSILTPFFYSLCLRLPVQTVSHEPLLGPEAVLESRKAWREHWRGASQQATCERRDNVCTFVQWLLTPLSSFRAIVGVFSKETVATAEALLADGVHTLLFCLLHYLSSLLAPVQLHLMPSNPTSRFVICAAFLRRCLQRFQFRHRYVKLLCWTANYHTWFNR